MEIKNIVLITLSMIISVSLIELGLWVFKYPPYPETIPDVYLSDKENGFVLRPNSISRHSSWEFDTSIKINNVGIRRSNNLTKKSPVSIFLLGDSQAQGYGVEEEDTISFNIEKLMRNGSVINLGVSSYSTIQEMVLFNRYLEFFEKKPKHAILVFSVANDFYDNKRITDHYLATGRNLQAVSKGYLVEDGSTIEINNNELILMQDGKVSSIKKNSIFHPPVGYESEWFEWSKLYNMWAWWNTKVQKSCSLPIAIPGLWGGESIENSEEWNLTKSALDSFIVKAQSENVIPHIVILPTKYQLIPDLFLRAGCDLESIDLESSINIIERYSVNNNINIINLFDEFKKLSDSDIGNLFYEVDEHLTAYGNSIAAEIIAKELK
jgi:hypothetical protein